ncbi:MAG: superoxide dismutase [Burkholderiales bacterium]|jgi:Fe-Mn family superoxide dismutase|nr:superoxide dismutase [Burkholderiales bacterium]
MSNPLETVSRRRFTQATLSGLALAGIGAPSILRAALPLALAKLPYDEGALAPVIGAQTVGIHWGRHHRAYVDNAARMVKGTALEGLSLGQIVKETAGRPDRLALFNNAAQAWNHDFYWQSLKPGGGGRPPAELARRLDADFGGMDGFRKAFAETCVGQFGSGWGWLAMRPSGALVVVRTANADVPMTQGLKPLLTIDVWEHAYYLDYQNRRADYVNAVIDRLANWQWAQHNIDAEIDGC